MKLQKLRTPWSHRPNQTSQLSPVDGDPPSRSSSVSSLLESNESAPPSVPVGTPSSTGSAPELKSLAPEPASTTPTQRWRGRSSASAGRMKRDAMRAKMLAYLDPDDPVEVEELDAAVLAGQAGKVSSRWTPLLLVLLSAILMSIDITCGAGALVQREEVQVARTMVGVSW